MIQQSCTATGCNTKDNLIWDIQLFTTAALLSVVNTHDPRKEQ